MRQSDFKRVVGRTHELWLANLLGLSIRRDQGLDMVKPNLTYGIESKAAWRAFYPSLSVREDQLVWDFNLFERHGMSLFLAVTFYDLKEGSRGGKFSYRNFELGDWDFRKLDTYCANLEANITRRDVYFVPWDILMSLALENHVFGKRLYAYVNEHFLKSLGGVEFKVREGLKSPFSITVPWDSYLEEDLANRMCFDDNVRYVGRRDKKSLNFRFKTIADLLERFPVGEREGLSLAPQDDGIRVYGERFVSYALSKELISYPGLDWVVLHPRAVDEHFEEVDTFERASGF